MNKGIVKKVSSIRGFGFIVDDSLCEDVFFHAKDCENGIFDRDLVGKEVQYNLIQTSKGKSGIQVNLVDHE